MCIFRAVQKVVVEFQGSVKRASSKEEKQKMEEESEAEKKFVKSQAKYITDGEVPPPLFAHPLTLHNAILVLLVLYVLTSIFTYGCKSL